MSLIKKIGKIPEKIIARAKYDDLLYTILQIGMASLAVSAPTIAVVAIYINAIQKKEGKYSKRILKNSFYHFQKVGLITVESRKGMARIELTKEGESRARLCGAGKILSANLSSGSMKWDGKWRIVFFDLKNEKNKERNAIRIMLRRCGFVFLQKSVWIYPYDCSSEIEFLRSFFRLSEKEFRLVISTEIGEDDQLKKHFRLLTSLIKV